MDQPKPVIDQALAAVVFHLHLARGALAIGNYERGLNALHGHVMDYLGVVVSCLNLDDELRKPLIGLRLAWEQQIIAFNTVTRSHRVGRLKNNLTTGAADLRRILPELAQEYEGFLHEASLILEPTPPATVTTRPLDDALRIAEDPFRAPRDKLLPVISALMPQGEVIVEFDPEPVAAVATTAGKNNNGKHGK